MGCLGGGTQQVTQNPVWYGPYGETGTNQKAIDDRASVMNASYPNFQKSQTIANQTAGMAQQGAQNPGFSQVNSLANNELNGKYLNGNPALTNQIASVQQQANRAAGDQAAQIRSGQQRAGMGFSTANQEAQQGAQAAQNANAMNTSANATLQNYQTERANQNNAGNLLNSNLTNQLNLNQAGISALYSPLSAQANLQTGLYTGGQTATPNTQIIQKPGMLDYASQILGML